MVLHFVHASTYACANHNLRGKITHVNIQNIVLEHMKVESAIIFAHALIHTPAAHTQVVCTQARFAHKAKELLTNIDTSCEA